MIYVHLLSYILNFVIFLNALKAWILQWKKTLNAHMHCLTHYTSFNVRVHSVGVLFDFAKYLKNVKLHIVKTITILKSQTIFIADPYL